MGLLIFVLIILLLAAAGVLGFVVKVALGVALGILAGVMLGAWAIRRRIRRLLYGSSRGARPRWRRVSRSTAEVVDRPSQSAGSPSPGSRDPGRPSDRPETQR